MQKQSHTPGPAFEEQVRSKMEELRFVAPDSSWLRLEQALDLEKRKRRPLIWVWWIAAIPLALGVFMLYPRKSNPRPKSVSQPLSQHKTNFPSHSESSSLKSQHPSDAAGALPLGEEDKEKKESVGPQNRDASAEENQRADKFFKKSSGLPEAKSTRTSSIGNGQSQAPVRDRIVKESQPESRASVQESLASAIGMQPADLSALVALPGWVRQGRVGPIFLIDRSSLRALANGGVSIKPAVASGEGQRKPWKLGAYGAIGSSGVQEYAGKGNMLPNATAGGTSATRVLSFPSNGLSFGIGAVLEKPLSRKLIFSTGIIYRYYANHLLTGQRADSLFPGAYYLTSVPAFGAPASSSTGHTQTFQFFELPAGLIWQINRNPHLPITAEGGISLSELVGSKSLYYDQNSGTYRSGGPINHTEFQFYTALRLGFYQGHNLWRIGPGLQYGATPLFDRDQVSTLPQHLHYAALVISFIPGKP
jgi:hypothetical protein